MERKSFSSYFITKGIEKEADGNETTKNAEESDFEEAKDA